MVSYFFMLAVGYVMVSLLRPIIEAMNKHFHAIEMEAHRRYMNEDIWQGDKG